MPKRRTYIIAGVTTLIVAGAGAMPAAHAAGGRKVVHPGESIQAAVDKAKPGDTILVMPGTYRESVLVTVNRLTLRGSGRATVIKAASARSKGRDNACSRAGHGICVTGTAKHRLSRVRIQSLTVEGFRKNGISASETDRMSVRGVLARDNGQQGISQEKSTRAVLRDNTAMNNGQSGVFLANMVDTEGPAIDTRGAVISGNKLSGNRIGVVIRRARNLTISGNTIKRNCGGVFIVGDENKPRAGALAVRGNDVSKNNKYCSKTKRLPFIQGTGVLLTGAEDTLITRNRIRDNIGKSPMSGGIVLFHSMVGSPNDRNRITRNEVLGNGSADLADRDKGKGNKFTGNRCRASEPAVRGRC